MFHAHTSPYTCKFSGDLGHMEWVFFQQAFVVGVVLPVVVPDDGRDVLMKVSCQFLATGLAGSRLPPMNTVVGWSCAFARRNTNGMMSFTHVRRASVSSKTIFLIQ